MVNKMISAFLVMIINDTCALDQGARCGYKVSLGPAGKPDCLSAARNSGQSSRLGSPSRNSSPSIKIEGSIPARNSSSRNTQTLPVQVLQRMVES